MAKYSSSQNRIQVGMDVIPTVDQKGLNELRNNLDNLFRVQPDDFAKIHPEMDTTTLKSQFEDIQGDVKKVRDAFSEAFNTKLGTTDLDKLNNSLKQLDMQKVGDSFRSLGSEGSKAFAQMAKEMTTVNFQFKESTKWFTEFKDSLANTARWAATSSIVNGITNSVRQAWEYSVKLDTALNDIRIVSGKSAEDMDHFAQRANDAAQALGKSTKDYAEAALIYYQQGDTDEVAQAKADVTLKTANVTGQSTQEVSEQLTAVWNGYKVDAQEAETYVDKLAAVAATTASDLEELSTGMSKVASAANAMGVDVDQLNAQLATIVSVTRQAPESVGTALKTIYSRMTDIESGLDSETTLGTYTSEMAEFGVNVLDANGKLRDTGDVIEEIGAKWNDMSREQQVALAQTMAGTRQYNNLLALFENFDQYNDALLTSQNSMGTLQEQQDTYMESTKAHLETLGAAWERIYDDMIDSKGINSLIDTFTLLTNGLGNFIEAIGGSSGALTALGTVGLRVFKDNISDSIATAITNSKKLKENLIQIQKAQENQQLLEAETKGGSQKSIEGIKERNQFLFSASNKGTISNPDFIQGQKISNEIADKQIELETFENQAVETVQRIQNAIGKIDLLKEEEEEIRNFTNILNSENVNASDIEDAFKSNQRVIQLFFESYREQIERTRQTLQGLSEATENILPERSELGKEEDRFTSDKFDQYKKSIEKASRLTNNENIPKDIRDSISENLGKLPGDNEQEFKNILNNDQGYDDLRDNLKRLINSINNAEASLTDCADSMENTFNKSMKNGFNIIKQGNADLDQATTKWKLFAETVGDKGIADNIVDLTSGFGELGLALQSFLNLPSIWTSEDLSDGEKLVQIIFSVTTALGGLYDGIKTIKAAEMGETFKQLGAKVGESLVDRSGKGGIGGAISTFLGGDALKDFKDLKDAADDSAEGIKKVTKSGEGLKNTGKNFNAVKEGAKGSEEVIENVGKETEGLSLIANTAFLKVTLIIAAIAAIGYGIYAIINKDKIEMQGLQAELEETEKTAADTQQKYSELSQTWSGYKDAETALQGAKEGTLEWYDAIAKVNEQAQELIDKLDLIAGEDYSIGAGGKIELNEDSVDEKLYKKQQQSFQAQAGVYAQKANIANVQANKIAEQFKNEVNRQVREQNSESYNIPQLNTSGARRLLAGETTFTEDDMGKSVNGENWNGNKDISTFFIDVTGELKDFKGQYMQRSAEQIAYQRTAADYAIRGNVSKDQVEKYDSFSTVQKQAIQDYVGQQMAMNAKSSSFDIDDSGTPGLMRWMVKASEWVNNGVSLKGFQTNEDIWKKQYLQDTEGYTQKDGQWYDSSGGVVSEDEIKKKINSYSSDLIEEYYKSGEQAAKDAYQRIAQQQENNQKTIADLTDSEGNAFSENSQQYMNSAMLAAQNGQEFDYSLLTPEELNGVKEALGSLGETIEATFNSIKRANLDLQDYNNTLKTSAEELDTTESSLQIYGAAMRNAGDIEESKNKQTAEIIATNYEFNKSYNETQEILYDNMDAFKDYSKAIKNHEDISYDVADAMGELKDSLSEMFDGADISAEVFQNNLETINKLLTGTEEEANEAYDTLSEAIQLDTLEQAFGDKGLSVDILPDEVVAGVIQNAQYMGESVISSYQQIVDAINNADPGGPMEASMSQHLAALINEAGWSFDQIQQFADNMNLDIPMTLDTSNMETNVDIDEIKWSTATQTVQHRYDGQMPNPNFDGKKDKREYIDVHYAWKETIDPKSESIGVPRVNGSDIKVKNNVRSNGGGNMGGRNFTPSQANKSNRSPSGGSKSPSSGNSSQPKDPDHMDPLEKEIDRYHDINIELKETQTQLDRLDKQKKKLFGQKLIDNINKQIGQLNDKIAETNQKIGIARNEVGELQAKLGAKGVAFAADGDIANYASAWQAQYNYVQSLINNYNGMSAEAQEKYKDTVEKAKKDFDEFEKNIKRYDELISDEIPGLEDDIQDAIDEKIDLQIEAFNMEIEIRLDLAEAERDWNEFKKKVIDGIDEDDILGNVRARLEDFWSYYKEDETGVIQRETAHLNDLLNQLRQIDATGTSSVYGDNKAQAMEDLKEYYEQLMEDLEGVVDLQEEVHEAYLDMMDEAQDKFDQQLDTFEQIADIIEHNMDLINLVYGEESYGALSGYYDRMEENYNKQVDFQRQQVVFWQEQMNTLEEGSEEWEQARDNWMDAVGDWRDTVNDAIENLQDKYLNTINDIFQRLNDHVTDGKGLEYVNEEWELINKNADEYLDTVNAMYGIQKLEKKYLDALDQTDSISAQRQIKELMDAELEDLRSRDKLTEYDIERAEKKYEIMLKQIALQEAQENKSKMRLRRDSQGNYTYQYVADDDAIGDLQDELSDMYNDLYNFDKDRYQQNLDSLYEIWTEFQEKMAEAAQINDPVARAERELLIKQQYEELINGIVDQNQQIRKNLYESAFQDLADLYNTDVENFNNMLDSEKEALMEGLIPYWDSGIQHMADVFAGEDGFLGVCRSAFEELKDATWNYENSLDELEDTAGVDFGEIADNIDDIIDATEELLWDNEDLIDSYREQLNAIQQVISLMETLISKYNTATQAAKNAASAAYDYWQMENRAAAAAAQRNKALMDSVTTGISDAMNKVNSIYSGNSGGGGGSGDGQLSVGDTATLNGRYYYDSYGVNPSGSLYSGVANGVVVDKINNNPFGVHIHSADGRYGDLGWVKRSQLSGYDTGGYTGEWNSKDGKLALLHEKELVLNKQDTKNLLSAIEIMRDITDSFNTTMLNKLKEITATKVDSNILSDTLEQNVHIDASFPNVESSREIEEALNNLVNMASMRIGRR